ncbi:MAG: bacillithiol biosynthesis protein BshC, partial [Gemmatimonadota bacterium]
ARRASRLAAGSFGCSTPAARSKLARILAGEGTFVTTGQQPLLFLGPLFTLYKALTAVEAARRLEGRREDMGPALALFWIASDDHDWDEIGRTALLDPGNELRTLTLAPPPGHAARPAGPTPLPEEIGALVDQLSDLLPESEFRDVHIALIRDAYRAGRPLGQAFAAALAGILDGVDFVWLDAAEPAMKRASAGLFRELLTRADEAQRAAETGAARVAGAGHEPPIPLLDGALPLMVDTGEARVRLYRDDAGIRAGRDGAPERLERWLERLDGDPGRFSPNVASRPLLEAWLLPVEASTLGPGELAYWSQLPPLFEAFDVPFPAVAARAAWTIVEPKIGRTLERLGATPEEMEDGGAAVIERLTREGRPAAVESALGELRAGLGRGFGALESAVAAELPGVRSAVGKARKLAFDAVATLVGTMDAQVRERSHTQVRQVHK